MARQTPRAAQLSVKGRRWCVFVKKSSQEHGEAPASRTMGKLRLGINFVTVDTGEIRKRKL
jgi:hypothetical protein